MIVNRPYVDNDDDAHACLKIIFLSPKDPSVRWVCHPKRLLI